MNLKLNVRQWIIAAIVLFVFTSIWGFLVARYVMPGWFPSFYGPNPEAENPMLARFWMYAARAVAALVFVYIFTRGYEGKPGLGEGLRFGVLIGLLMNLPGMFTGFVTSGKPVELVITQTILGFVATMLSGLIAGAIYKGQPKPTT